MSARLRERILWRSASALGDGGPDPAVMARAGAHLFFAVGFFALVSLLLSPFPQANVPSLAGLVGCAWALAAGMLVAYDRMPAWGFQVLLAG